MQQTLDRHSHTDESTARKLHRYTLLGVLNGERELEHCVNKLISQADVLAWALSCNALCSNALCSSHAELLKNKAVRVHLVLLSSDLVQCLVLQNTMLFSPLSRPLAISRFSN